MVLISSALLLGFLHGLGADHLMAICALSVDTAVAPDARRARALGVALRFALGHAVLLALGAGILVAIGWSLPVVIERGGEVAGGILLVALGAAGLWGIAGGRVYGHSHTHGHEPAAHWHLHIGRPDHHPMGGMHSHLPTIIGAAFAVSSLRALALLTPFGDRLGGAPVPVLLGLIGIFAVGIVLSMSLFGIAFARVLTTRAVVRLGRSAAAAMAFASIGLGVYWIVKF